MARGRRRSAPKKRKFFTAVRSAITGRFLKKGSAKKRPRTTVTERIPVRRSGKKRRR